MAAENDNRVRTVYEYCLLRYVPDIERGEWMNIGLLMMCKRWRWLRAELHIDEARLRHLSPDADIPRLRLQTGVFARADVPFKDLPVEERYRWMAAVKSAIIQTSPSHPGLLICPADAPGSAVRTQLDAIFESLFARLVL